VAAAVATPGPTVTRVATDRRRNVDDHLAWNTAAVASRIPDR